MFVRVFFTTLDYINTQLCYLIIHSCRPSSATAVDNCDIGEHSDSSDSGDNRQQQFVSVIDNI